ncbi:cysteine-rich receptor-like protein kinase 6 [Silene latifolia]|uniref:cysteine-rich receptor-like protein kinase 6 n=1 Tax=Silene latifolia TaxID=37657 RepID=UPI003D776147
MIIPLFSSAPTYVNSICSNTTMFTTKSQYQTNLNTVFQYLSDNATNPFGFHAAQAGNGTKNFVYGHFLCRGDQVPSSCQECVTTATTTDLPKTYCPNRKEAIIWYDQCMVRYSNKSFFGVLQQDPGLVLTNTQNVTGNVSQFFIDVMNNMMNNVVIRAANGGPNKKYATTYAPYPGLMGIYGLEQCTPDLSALNCAQCLLNAIGSLPISEGAQTILPSCSVRFEISPFFNGASNLTVSPPPPSLPPSPPASRNNSTRTSSSSGNTTKRKLRTSMTVAFPTAAAIAILLFLGIYLCVSRWKATEKVNVKTDEVRRFADSLQFDFNTIQVATHNFAAENKLGEGGFGEVYKGQLKGGQEVAAKRLSKNSIQGIAEFETEIVLVARLQHKNLVKLLGYCASPDESLLVYEFLPNSSLDKFLFDPAKKSILNWRSRFNIIYGIAKGLQYLHEDSRIKVVHRDLKSSNILLDEDMNPKIADFGLARLFEVDQTQGDTKRIVGTYGYMAPEYAITGHYSVKSDVYSFGVIVLEIVSGQRNRSFGRLQLDEALLHRVWRLWNEDEPLNVIDTVLEDNFEEEQVLKCIQLGLLCIQEHAIDRPRMTSIVAALSGQAIRLPTPKPPHFFSGAVDDEARDIPDGYTFPYMHTGNETITNVYSRD